MSVTLNEAGLRQFFDNPTGPVGRMIEEKLREVEGRARINASNNIIGIWTGDLLRALDYTFPVPTADGVGGTVGSDSTHGVPSFAYPGWWDSHGKPWLTQAFLDSGFERG